MQLIKSIEIRYFRSLYDVKLEKISDLSIIFGRNDVGKSNAIRALNLFFNYQTNPELLFDFKRDFSKVRFDEGAKKSGAKKFLYIKIVFNVPKNNQASLGEELWVKRQWTTESEATKPTQTSSVDTKPIRFLNTFLNAIDFTYIPAIKDRKIFENLLGRLYKALSTEKDFVASLSNFTKELDRRTKSLSKGLKDNISVHSSIAPPDNLQNLFKSLDFHTGPTNEQFSLTLQRGDGVQVRHIPEILKFIADTDGTKYWHIWGFEEPENSLEYASAIAEAKLFQTYSRSKNKQIFITSHSPAFFGLQDEHTQKFLISTSETFGQSIIEPFNKSLHEASFKMGEMEYLQVATEALEAKKIELEELEEEKKKLVSSIKRGDKPILFVEGDTDKTIFEAAWKVFNPKSDLPFIIKPAGGTKGIKGLNKSRQFLQEAFSGRKIFVLVDNDQEGRATTDKGKFPSGGNWHKAQSYAYWCLLQATSEYKKWAESNNVPDNLRQFTIENCFSIELRREAISDGAYRHSETADSIFFNEGSKFNNNIFLTKVMATNDDDDWRFHTHPPDHNFKERFAEWITKKERRTVKNFEAFEKICEGLKKELSKSVQEGTVRQDQSRSDE